MQGIKFVIVSRKVECKECKSELPVGTKTVIVGSFTNKYRYCLSCFMYNIDKNCYIRIDGNEIILE